MQTFLPYSDFDRSAAVLDNKRLGKQRVETKQILIALGRTVGEHAGRPESRWRNHPAVRMWADHERALAQYGAAVCREWKRRGFRDSLHEQFCWVAYANGDPVHCPAWIGNDAVHASHRSNLIRKLPEHYGQFGWPEPADMPYVWPCA